MHFEINLSNSFRSIYCHIYKTSPTKLTLKIIISDGYSFKLYHKLKPVYY